MKNTLIALMLMASIVVPCMAHDHGHASETPAVAPAATPKTPKAPTACETACAAKKAAKKVAKEAPAVAPAAAPQVAAPVAPKPIVIATVGKVAITDIQISRAMAAMAQRVPPEQRQRFVQQQAQIARHIFSQLVQRQLWANYVTVNKSPYDQKNVDALKKNLATMAAKMKTTPAAILKKRGQSEADMITGARCRKLFETIGSEKSIADFKAKYPDWFNGTKVGARHILFGCPQIAASKTDKETLAKANAVKAQIVSGKLTFEAAAKANSVCPSKKKGGDLGEFEFSRMVPPFSMACYSAKQKTVIGPVRTQFGWHLIELTSKTQGTAKPGEQANAIAKSALQGLFEAKLYGQLLTDCPIVYNEPPARKAKPAAKPAKAPAKASAKAPAKASTKAPTKGK
jgi:peptidyl-prolyl cis-trans isomerase C